MSRSTAQNLNQRAKVRRLSRQLRKEVQRELWAQQCRGEAPDGARAWSSILATWERAGFSPLELAEYRREIDRHRDAGVGSVAVSY